MSKPWKILLIVGLAVIVFLLVSLIAAIGVSWADSIQGAVQPMHCLDIWADSLATSGSITVIPDWPAEGMTFATSEACSVLCYSSSSCVDDLTYMHFETNECFEFPQLGVDSVKVVNKSASNAFIRIWFWRR